VKRFACASLLLIAATAFAQNVPPTAAPQAPSQLDQAYDEMRASYVALQQAMTRRDQGLESQPGERQASAAGGSRPNENYFARQGILEQDVMFAQRRYEAALKRWNDLK
jgi:hypothetical protein